MDQQTEFKTVSHPRHPVQQRVGASPKIDGPWRIETLSSTAQMRQHARAWLDLELESIDPHAAFQCYVWCESWASTFCEHNPHLPQPRIFLIYRGDVLMAILPMMLSRHMGAKLLTLFGEPHSQIANAITRAGYDCSDGLRLCVEQAAMLTSADVVALGPLPHDSVLARALDLNSLSPDPAEAMSLVQWEGANRSEDYVARLSKNRRKDFNKKMNRLREVGPVRMERVDVGDDAFKPLVRQALAFKHHWLRDNGIASVGLSREGVDEFLTRFVDHEGGFLPELEVLYAGPKLIGININLVGRNVRHCYLSSYDPDCLCYSPGTVLHQLSIRACVDDGMHALNFLGFPTDFKKMWSTDTVPLLRYQRAVTLRGKLWLRLWTDGFRPAIKRVLMHARSAKRLPFVGKLVARHLSALAPSGK